MSTIPLKGEVLESKIKRIRTEVWDSLNPLKSLAGYTQDELNKESRIAEFAHWKAIGFKMGKGNIRCNCVDEMIKEN